MFKEVAAVVIAYQKLQDDPDFLFLLDLFSENPLMDDLLDKLSHLEDVLARPKATNTRPMLHPGFTARSNNGAGPATSKPDIIPTPTSSHANR